MELPYSVGARRMDLRQPDGRPPPHAVDALTARTRSPATNPSVAHAAVIGQVSAAGQRRFARSATPAPIAAPADPSCSAKASSGTGGDRGRGNEVGEQDAGVHEVLRPRPAAVRQPPSGAGRACRPRDTPENATVLLASSVSRAGAHLPTRSYPFACPFCGGRDRQAARPHPTWLRGGLRVLDHPPPPCNKLSGEGGWSSPLRGQVLGWGRAACKAGWGRDG